MALVFVLTAFAIVAAILVFGMNRETHTDFEKKLLELQARARQRESRLNAVNDTNYNSLLLNQELTEENRLFQTRPQEFPALVSM